MQKKRGAEETTVQDAWLKVARAMREAALTQAEVATLRESASFETRGRGEPVAGVALRRQRGGAVARVGVVLDEAVVEERLPLRAFAQNMRSQLLHAWKQAGRRGQQLRVDVHLLDIADVGQKTAEQEADGEAADERAPA